MPSVKLTKRVIETARPEDRDVILWDTTVRGFGCKITTTGRKAFILKYRVGGGRGGTMRKPTIGPYGELTVDQARAIARDWLAEIRKGGDPSARRQAERKALKVTDLCDRYLSEHVELHNKPRTVREVRRLVEGRIRPEFGNLKIGEFSRADVSRLHKSMSRTPYEANRVLAALSKMFNLAEAWGLRPDGSNPCRHVQRYRERARERFLNAGELHCLGEALSVVEREAVVPPAVLAVIRFLALTGCRVSEALELTWQHVDIGAGIVRIVDAKAGSRDLVPGAPALALLAACSGGHKGPVFSAPDGSAISLGRVEWAWKKVRGRATVIAWRKDDDAEVAGLVARLAEGRERLPSVEEVVTAAIKAGIELPVGFGDARLHDLRHTVGTFAGQGGANAFLVRDMLGHKTLAMTGRYVERDVDPHRALADSVAGRIEAAMAGREGEVITLPKRR